MKFLFRSTMAIKTVSFLLLALLVISSSGCSLLNTGDDGDGDAEQRESLLADPDTMGTVKLSKEYSVEDIYAECNKTFIITRDYLNELNDTGSFPDETDKTPMVGQKLHGITGQCSGLISGGEGILFDVCSASCDASCKRVEYSPRMTRSTRNRR